MSFEIEVKLCCHYLHTTTLNLDICRGKPFKVDLIDISKHKFIQVILFYLDHTLCTPLGVNNAQLLWDSKPIRLLETPRSVMLYYYYCCYYYSLIEKDHLGDWSPEKDCCYWLMLRQPVRKPSSESSGSVSQLKRTPITQMIFFNQGMLLLGSNHFLVIIIIIIIIKIKIKIIRKSKFLMCYIWQVVADLKFHTECFSCGRCQHFLGEEDNYVLLERHRLVW